MANAVLMPGQLIRRRRLELKLTQKQVGKACGVTASAVTQWENGDTSPIKHIKPLCRALRTTPDQLGLVDPGQAGVGHITTIISSGPFLDVRAVQPIILPDGKAGLALIGQEGQSIVLEASAPLTTAMRSALDAIEAHQRR